ncbi:hypothetical protein C8R48DRAFT_794523 [Suillus tomentosus]|nr:hypothetical protein C8R48DRAFT_794523 [Suillus tomentosus]
MAPGLNLKSGSGFGANQNRFGRVRTPPRLSSVSAYITSILLLLLQVPDSYWLVVLSRDLHASQVSKQRPQAVNKGLARYNLQSSTEVSASVVDDPYGGNVAAALRRSPVSLTSSLPASLLTCAGHLRMAFVVLGMVWWSSSPLSASLVEPGSSANRTSRTRSVTFGPGFNVMMWWSSSPLSASLVEPGSNANRTSRTRSVTFGPGFNQTAKPNLWFGLAFGKFGPRTGLNRTSAALHRLHTAYGWLATGGRNTDCMRDAQMLLGPAGSGVRLLGARVATRSDPNPLAESGPTARAVVAVLSSQNIPSLHHGQTGQMWSGMGGPLQLCSNGDLWPLAPPSLS